MRNTDLNYWEWCLYFTLFHFIFPVYYIYIFRLSVVISYELWHFISVFVCLFSLSQSFCLLCFYGVSEQFLDGTSAHNRPFQCFMGLAAWNKMDNDNDDDNYKLSWCATYNGHSDQSRRKLHKIFSYDHWHLKHCRVSTKGFSGVKHQWKLHIML